MLTKMIGSPTELSFGLEKLDLKPVIRNFIDITFPKITLPLTKSDWIFFSSGNAVKSLIQQNIDISSFKIACIGHGTSSCVPRKYHVEFIGKNSDTNSVAKEFAKVVKNDRVLFPISNISNRTVQKHLSPSQIDELVVYTTTELGQKVDAYPILVFSSPSQWKGYRLHNTPESHQLIFTFGKITALAIESEGYAVAGYLKSITVPDLITTIKDHLVS